MMCFNDLSKFMGPFEHVDFFIGLNIFFGRNHENTNRSLEDSFITLQYLVELVKTPKDHCRICFTELNIFFDSLALFNANV